MLTALYGRRQMRSRVLVASRRNVAILRPEWKSDHPRRWSRGATPDQSRRHRDLHVRSAERKGVHLHGYRTGLLGHRNRNGKLDFAGLGATAEHVERNHRIKQ